MKLLILVLLAIYISYVYGGIGIGKGPDLLGGAFTRGNCFLIVFNFFFLIFFFFFFYFCLYCFYTASRIRRKPLARKHTDTPQGDKEDILKELEDHLSSAWQVDSQVFRALSKVQFSLPHLSSKKKTKPQKSEPVDPNDPNPSKDLIAGTCNVYFFLIFNFF